MTAFYLDNRIETEERSDSTPRQRAAVKNWMRRNWDSYIDDPAATIAKAAWDFAVPEETVTKLAAEVAAEGSTR